MTDDITEIATMLHSRIRRQRLRRLGVAVLAYIVSSAFTVTAWMGPWHGWHPLRLLCIAAAFAVAMEYGSWKQRSQDHTASLERDEDRVHVIGALLDPSTTDRGGDPA